MPAGTTLILPSTPGMRKALFNKIKAQATHGTGANEWSARKAQLLAKQYKAKGGSYKD
jgi:hypothetical protein